jgi:hypothetical protein
MPNILASFIIYQIIRFVNLNPALVSVSKVIAWLFPIFGANSPNSQQQIGFAGLKWFIME